MDFLKPSLLKLAGIFMKSIATIKSIRSNSIHSELPLYKMRCRKTRAQIFEKKLCHKHFKQVTYGCSKII